MAFDSTGKYHMNPHHAKMADNAPKKGAEGSPAEESSEPKGEAMAEGDDVGSQMMTCPSCGAQFPEEMGLAQPDAMPQPQQPSHESQGASMPVLGGY